MTSHTSIDTPSASWRARCGVLFVLMLCVSPGAFAQTARMISGLVTDTTGAVVSGVSVTLRNQTTGTTYGTTTDEVGRYRYENLAGGTYELTFSSEGFEVARRTLSLTTESATVDVELGLGALTTTITVREAGGTTADVGGKTTASRMNIPNTELPVQVSSIPLQVLESQGVRDMVTAMRNVSGASSFRGYGMYEYENIRGFAGSTAVNARLVDGMRIEGNRLNSQLLGIEQIDVLKGPSAILYGNSTLGGAVNVILKKPQAEPSYELFYRGGSFNTHQVAAGATGAILGSQRLFYRADIGYENTEGWREAGARRFSVSPTLTWLVSNGNQLVVRESFTRDEFDGDAGIPVGLLNDVKLSTRFNTPQDFARLHDSRTQVLWNATLSDRLQFRNSFFYLWSNDQYFTAESLTYQPALNQVNRQFLYFKHHRRPVLNQADLTGAFDVLGMPHQFLVGYEYQDFYNFTNRSERRSVATTPVSLATFAETHVPVPDFPLSRVDHSTNLSNAVFWQDQIAVTDRLKINVGGRLDDFRRTSRNDPYLDGVSLGLGPELRRHQTPYTYRAGAVYSVTGNQQAYVSSATSFRPVTVVPGDGRELEPETGRSIEAGHRWQGFNGRFEVSTAIYRIILRNVVVGRGNQIFDQAGQQSSKGIDIDVSGDIGSGLRLIANYGYTVPKYDEFFASNGAVDLSGKRPRMTQRHAGNFWLTKSWSSGLATSAGVRRLSSIFNDDLNAIPLEGYTLVNGAISYRRGNYELGLNVENLLDKNRYFHPTWLTSQVTPGQPINVFATLRVRFR
jgi:iron complex outermembrane recepter protein